MNDMRKLLSGSIPAPEDEPGLRDVIGPAMAWGDRRRRLEWSLAGAAALAVVALGAGVASLGGSTPNVNAAPGGGGSPTPTGMASSSANGGVLPCTLPNGQPGQPGSDYCTLQAEVQGGFNREFAAGALQYIQADLPQGVTATAPQPEALNASNPGYLVLSGPGGKNLLYLGLAVSNSSKPGVVVGSEPSMGESAEWADGSANGTRLVVNLTLTDAVGHPTAKAPLLTTEQLRRIMSDPALQKYAGDQNKRWEDLNRRFQHYLPPSPPSATGSIVRPPSPSLSSLPWPSSTGSVVSPPIYSSPICVPSPPVSSYSGAPTAASSPSCPPTSWPSTPPWTITSSAPPSTTFTSVPVPTGSHS